MGTAPRAPRSPEPEGAERPSPLRDRAGRAARSRAARRPLPPVASDWRAYLGLALIAFSVVLGLFATRGGGGGDEDAPPSRRAAALVPADALAYVNVSTDGDRAAVGRALALLDRFPADAALRGTLTRMLRPGGSGGADGPPIDLARDVRPWLGDEAALAITRGAGTTAGSLMLLAVAEDELATARAYLARGAGAARDGTHRGVALKRYGNGTVTAYVDGFLVIGQQRSVRGAIDRAVGGDGGAGDGDGDAGAAGARARSLADDPVYREATAGAPEDRVAEAYASVDGVRRLLAPQQGLLGLAGTLLDQRGLRGTALALTAQEDRARVRVHAILDPRGRTPAPAFTPTLTDSVPADALAYAGFAGIERAAPVLLGISGLAGLGEADDLLAQAGRVLRAGGVDVARDVLPLFGREVAVVAVPADGGTPAIALLARTGDADRTRTALTRLEPAIARLFTPAGGAAPAWSSQQAGGATVRRLAPAEGVELDYAVVGDTVALATSTAAIAAVTDPARSINDNSAYKATVSDSNRDLTSVVFFDFSQLLSLLGDMGLTRGLGGDAAASDLMRVRAVGLTSASEEAQSTAELTLEIP